MEGGLKKVRLNNGIRSKIGAAVGGLDLLSPDRAKRLAAAETAFRAHDAKAEGPVETALAKETDPAIKTALLQAHAAILAASGSGSEPDRLAAVATLKARGDADAMGLVNQMAVAPDASPAVKNRGGVCSVLDPVHAQSLASVAELLVRHIARLGPAARRDRARDHLRGHGHHQHGAWRDGDDRRLHDLRGAANHPFGSTRPHRRFGAGCRAARLRRFGRGRDRDRASGHSPPLWPAARDAACHLGRVL